MAISDQWNLSLGRRNVRILLGVTLIAISVAGGFLLTRSSRLAFPVLVAARDLGINHELGVEDVISVEVTVPANQQEQLIRVTDQSDAIGKVTLRPLKSGELLTRSSLSNLPSSRQEVPVTLTSSSAIDPRLAPGDHVDVIATFGKGASDARTVVVARGVQVVVMTGSSESGPLSISESEQITLGVEPDEALAIIFAMHNGELALVRTVPGIGSSPSEVTAGTLLQDSESEESE